MPKKFFQKFIFVTSHAKTGKSDRKASNFLSRTQLNDENRNLLEIFFVGSENPYIFAVRFKKQFMLAIVSIAGQQFKVKSDNKFTFTVLMPQRWQGKFLMKYWFCFQMTTATLGTPVVTSASVEATVMNYVQGDKVIVYKKEKEEKDNEKEMRHRQAFTQHSNQPPS